jgi:Family of unknown function (DUF6599)
MIKRIGALLGLACLAAVAQPTCALVPGWTQAGAARSFTADNLFEYMDGNAEGYVLYNFREMHGVTCKKGDVTFVVDVSDLGDADFSYGLFASNRDLRQPAYAVGMGGQIVPRRLIFAKGQYYIEIAADPEGDHTAALKLWAAALEKSIPGNATPPPALSWFPTERQQSLRLVPESVLGLRILKRGYMAQYDDGKAFVVIEESPEAAAATMQKFKARLAGSADTPLADEAFRATDQYLGRLCVFRKGRYVAGYAITAGTVDPSAPATALAAKLP